MTRDEICLITPTIPRHHNHDVRVDVDLCDESDQEEKEEEKYVPLFERLKAISTQLEQQRQQQQQSQSQQIAPPILPPTQPSSSSSVAALNLQSMSVTQLQSMCAKYGLVVSDDREKMIRLLAAIIQQPLPPSSSAGAGRAASLRSQPAMSQANNRPAAKKFAALPSPTKPDPLTITQQQIIQHVAEFIQNDETLYSHVLCFTPLVPEEVMNKMVQSGDAKFRGISYQHVLMALDHLHVFVKGQPRHGR